MGFTSNWPCVMCMMLAMTRKGSEYLGAREDNEDQEAES